MARSITIIMLVLVLTLTACGPGSNRQAGRTFGQALNRVGTETHNQIDSVLP